MRNGAVVINSARGPIVNTPDLIEAIESGKIAHAVIDCWEGEPNVSQRLLQLATIATPHIAGYSLNGKIRATSMAVNALCEAFGVDYRMKLSIPTGAAHQVTATAIATSYDPRIDTARLKNYRIELPDSSEASTRQISSEEWLRQTSSEVTEKSPSSEEAAFASYFETHFASHFESLRNNYPLRPEVPETEG